MVNVNLNNALERASTSANRYYSAWDETDKWDEHFQQEYQPSYCLRLVNS